MATAKYLEDFRDGPRARALAGALLSEMEGTSDAYRFMEVCGTHTMAAFRFGIRSLLPPSLKLLSGPGCPVCVTPTSYIDTALECARGDKVIVATFGDMLRVPGKDSSLVLERARGADVRVMYSPMDALELAGREPESRVVFLGVGFETTAPAVAAAVVEARRRGLRNFFVHCAHKLIPPAMRAIVESGEVSLDGFLCPAHVSAIIGADAYRFLAREHELACVVAGFETLDMLAGILMLARQRKRRKASVENAYRRVVRAEGNQAALSLLEEVFEPGDAEWRGLGKIPGSGLHLSEKYRAFDAAEEFGLEAAPSQEPQGCLCGEILRGVAEPPDCPLFEKTCTPENPVGACMVSSEGTCAAFYKYAER
jgi:hydrogenase expression/formation protein HypD